MPILLPTPQRELLIRQHGLERDGRIRDRIKAVLLRDDGYSYVEISRILLKDDVSVRRYVNEYVKSHQLKPQHHGSAPKLNDTQERQLIAHLTTTTYLYVKDIAAYIEACFGISYSISGLRDWLRAHDFRYKKPQPTPAKANPTQQEAFIVEYKALKDQALNRHEPIYFIDSVHPHHQTQLAYGWILRGLKKYIATPGKPLRLNITGAIDLSTYDVIYQQSDTINADHLQGFLTTLRANHPHQETIHVILDNAGYHHSKALIAYADKRGITFHYLPPYSPNLNPIERLWKLLRQAVTYNHYYASFAQFTEAILAFFHSIPHIKPILVERINDNFQRVQQPNFLAAK